MRIKWAEPRDCSSWFAQPCRLRLRHSAIGRHPVRSVGYDASIQSRWFSVQSAAAYVQYGLRETRAALLRAQSFINISWAIWRVASTTAIVPATLDAAFISGISFAIRCLYPVAQPYRGRTSTGLAQLCPCLPDEHCHSSDDAQHHSSRFTISTNTRHHIAKLESHTCCGRYTKRINQEGTKLVEKTVAFCIRKVPGLSEKRSTVVNTAALRCVRFLSLDLMEVAEYGLALQSVKSIVKSLDSIRFLTTSQTVRRTCHCLFTVFQCVAIRLVGTAALFAFCIDLEGLGGCAHLLSLTILLPHLANIEQVLTLVQGSSGSSRREGFYGI